MAESLLDHLIRQRIYAVLSDLYELMGDEIEDAVDTLINVEDSVLMGQLNLLPELRNGDSLFLREQYALQHYSLSIQYHYAYLDAAGKALISFDNRPHHPHLATYPHHKHHYPKSSHPPVGFSGEFLDAIREFVWLFEMRKAPDV